jgi:hypothetical protein
MQTSGNDYLKIGQSFIRGYAKGYHFTKKEQNMSYIRFCPDESQEVN